MLHDRSRGQRGKLGWEHRAGAAGNRESVPEKEVSDRRAGYESEGDSPPLFCVVDAVREDRFRLPVPR